MRKKIRTPLSYDCSLDVGEINTEPSLTVPDQTMSIREIMARYARGLPIDGARVEIWEGEDSDLPDPRTLDLAERQELAEEFTEEITRIRTAHASRKKQKNERTNESAPDAGKSEETN